MSSIRLLILDVDGVLTDGSLPYDRDGQEIKTFHVRDGGAIGFFQSAGGIAAIISGRSSPAVDARARDLGITLLHQGVADKLAVYEDVCREAKVSDAEACFIGDDVIDLPPMRRCGYPIAVADAAPLVKRAAKYVTRLPGGHGAVAEAVDRLLRYNGTRNGVLGRPTARSQSRRGDEK